MILVLLRHGRTEANEQHLYCGSTDLPLSENGKKELLDRKAAISYPCMEGMRVMTSGLQRTNETLRLLYGKEPDAIIPELAEMNFGKYEMHSYEQLKSDPEYIHWITDEIGTVAPEGGESRNAFLNRIRRAVDDLSQDSLIVTHGGVIAQIMEYCFPEENKGFYDWQPACGCGYRIDTKLHVYTCIGCNI